MVKCFPSLVFVLLIASGTFANECSPVNYRRAFANANNVFLGEAVEYRDNPTVKEDALLIVKFRVEKSWKGTRKGSEIVIPTMVGGLGELKYVEIGKKYLVYTFGKQMIMSLMCSPSFEVVTDPKYADVKYQAARINQLNSRWFRFWARMLPF